MESKGVGFKNLPAIETGDMVFIGIPVLQPVYKRVKHIRLTLHGRRQRIPVVKIPHDADSARIGRPDHKTVGLELWDIVTSKGIIGLLRFSYIEKIDVIDVYIRFEIFFQGNRFFQGSFFLYGIKKTITFFLILFYYKYSTVAVVFL
jgi:hypothetical protein